MSHASNAFSFYSGQVELGNDDGTVSPYSPETFTAIDEVQVVDFTGSKTDLADVTNVYSPSARREYIATLIDSGDMNFTANFIPGNTTQVSLQSTMDARATRNWKVILPAALGTFSFAGIITSVDRNLDFAKEAKLTCKVKITGPVAFA